MHVTSIDIHHVWLPKSAPLGIVLCVHGIGLHGGSFDRLGQSLSQRGYAVLAIDIRGLGCWRKWGQHTLDLRGTILDLQRAILELREMNPELPIFLAGESLGGALALKCASLDETKIDGLILSAPALDTERHFFNYWELWLKYYVMRGGRVSLIQAVIERAEDDDEYRSAWINDPLATTEVYARDLVAVRELVRDNVRSARMIKDTPTLVLQGYNDRLFRPSNTLSVFDQLATPKKELVYIGDAQHLMLQSQRPDHRCLSVLTGWVDTITAGLVTALEPATGAPYCKLRLVSSAAAAESSDWRAA